MQSDHRDTKQPQRDVRLLQKDGEWPQREAKQKQRENSNKKELQNNHRGTLNIYKKMTCLHCLYVLLYCMFWSYTDHIIRWAHHVRNKAAHVLWVQCSTGRPGLRAFDWICLYTSIKPLLFFGESFGVGESLFRSMQQYLQPAPAVAVLRICICVNIRTKTNWDEE